MNYFFFGGIISPLDLQLKAHPQLNKVYLYSTPRHPTDSSMCDLKLNGLDLRGGHGTKGVVVAAMSMMPFVAEEEESDRGE